MFFLNEENIATDLNKINLINISYYSSKSEIMNIYDTNFEFNENIIPLVTSVLELKPNVVHAKRYSNVNSESVIIIDSQNTIPNKSKFAIPSFFHDMQNIVNYPQCYNRNLVNSIDVNNDMLIRMYDLKAQNADYGQYILNEEELIIIIWNLEYVNFQIIINKEQPTECKLQLNIYITEDNKIISNKAELINNIIAKIDKIKKILVNCE